jgi:UDP-N-acetylglucosamine--N-acetylmuramyl-(pentapeptide) pyrophosphoryl-undecaprenol N-acetylglucosamine transferase
VAGEKLVLLAAGGTGGHLFPAEALSHALSRRGCAIELVTDSRVEGLVRSFPARQVHALPAATPSGKNILGKGAAVLTLGLGVLKARRLLRRLSPAAVVGFGGYPTVPPLVAASMLRLPTILHEQNAVLGRANRFLASRVDVIATGFAKIGNVAGPLAGKIRHVGNPVRPMVIEAAKTPYEAPVEDGELRLLVFGGSQGARVMSEIVPSALATLRPNERARLRVVQQAREEDVARASAAYARAGIAAELAPFFRDLPARMARSHLVISRAGASTVAEIAVIGRPSILVPLPGSLDQDQAANADILASAEAGMALSQPQFTPENLAAIITPMLSASARLAAMAAAAREVAIPGAAERLADLVWKTARLAD